MIIIIIIIRKEKGRSIKMRKARRRCAYATMTKAWMQVEENVEKKIELWKTLRTSTVTCRGLTGGGGRMEAAGTTWVVMGGCWWSEGGCCQGCPVRPKVPCTGWCCKWIGTCECSCDGIDWLLVLLCSTACVTRGSVEATEEIFRTVCEMSYWLLDS